MIERVIDNWLTNVNELGYTLPFCEVLISEGYTILHVARGGPGEHGKDVIARDASGLVRTFQLKGGDVTYKKWGDIRAQVEDLVRLPARYPGIGDDEPYVPCLVTNGDLVGDAVTSVAEYTSLWQKQGHPRLEVIAKGALLRRFLDAHGEFLPTGLIEFTQFVELYVADHHNVLPRAALATFLESLVASDRVGSSAASRRRAVESMALVGAYLAHGYDRAENHVAVAMCWTIVASVALHVAERERLPLPSYAGTVRLAAQGVDAAIRGLEKEVLASRDFVSPELAIVEPMTYGPRAAIVLSWLAVGQLMSRDDAASQDDVLAVFRRELPNQRFLGEADWPGMQAIAIFLGRAEPTELSGSYTLTDRLVSKWLESVMSAIRTDPKRGIPSPYWLPEAVLARLAGQVSPEDDEEFGRDTYTAMSAADMLVRRMCRQRINSLWPELSRNTFCDFVPERHADWFLWRVSSGDTVLEHPAVSRSWSEWRASAGRFDSGSVPKILQEHPDFVLPFALTYPHRANRALCGFIDAYWGKAASL